MRILGKYDIEVGQDKIEMIEKLINDGGKVNVRLNCFAYTKSGTLYIFTENEDENTQQGEVKVMPESVVNWQGRSVSFNLIEIDGKFENVNKKFANSCLDYDKIKGVIVLRKRRAGDRVRLVNREHSSDVRVLMKQGFPVHKRDSAVLLADDEGIVLAENFGAADRVRIDSSTRRVLVFEVIPE
jgi:tRNA(Ile)-lysidine synthase